MQPNVTTPHSSRHPRLSVCCLFVSLLCLLAFAITPTDLRAQAALATDPRASAPGSIEGSLRLKDSSKPAPNVSVTIRETNQTVTTDDKGRYVFPSVAPGTYTLLATGEGYGRTRITDVVVRPGHDLSISRQTIVAKSPTQEPLELEDFVVSAKSEGVLELDPYAVEGRKEKPFATGNMDIPRTINDAQPYYIFDAKTLDQSGAVNVEEFLKQRLTMNTTIQTFTQQPTGIMGNISSVNLRGLGTDKTLILINGRRMAGVRMGATDFQPDLNGIPLGAIERIEVLPASASGIYGGSAIGGVVNVILKRDYVGGEIRATYENDWHSDAPRRTLSLSYSLNLEGGKTHINVNASWQDAEALLLQDRVDIFKSNLNSIQSRSPSFLFNSTTPWLGALPNITASTPTATSLVLKDGNVILSRNTYVPAGTSTSTSSADLNARLLANGGQWDFDFPLSTQSSTGLLRPLTSTPEMRSLQASVRRKMLPRLEAFADFSYNENRTDSIYHPFSNLALTVPAAAPTNPFTTAVRVMVPDASVIPSTTRSQNRSASIGIHVELPWDWTAALDYTWSESRFESLQNNLDGAARTADLLSGVLNPFVDTLRYPLNFKKYLVPFSNQSANKLNALALRGSGALLSLPWGQPTLTLGLEHRRAQTPESTTREDFPVTLANSYVIEYYKRTSTTDSAYLEMTVPLAKKACLPGVHALDLQLSGRSEHYQVDTGTSFKQTFYNLSPATASYGSPTLNGQPYFAEAGYSSNNYTVGLKYQPVPDLSVRVSRATAFLPPTPAQLVKNPLPGTFTTSILDPVTGRTTAVFTLSGGNPDLKPQSSDSFNLGVIWEPKWKPLAGLRLNAEYYRIEQANFIGVLGAQRIVNLESLYPERVVRDATGTITQVDNSMVNLYSRDTEGWDLSASYTLSTPLGRFSLYAVQSTILHLKNQYSLSLPETNAVNFPSESGAAKNKRNITLNWEWRGWTAGWTTRYFGSYKQFGSAGGPNSVQFASGGVYDTTYITAGGLDTIPSQTYHDVYFGYSFGNHLRENSGDSRLRAGGKKLLEGVSVQLNVRNLFDKVAPLDPFYSPYYVSPYDGGLAGLRSYALTVKKSF